MFAARLLGWIYRHYTARRGAHDGCKTVILLFQDKDIPLNWLGFLAFLGWGGGGILFFGLWLLESRGLFTKLTAT